MRTKQESITFPIRKTRSSNKTSKHHARTTRANNRRSDLDDTEDISVVWSGAEEVIQCSSEVHPGPSQHARRADLWSRGEVNTIDVDSDGVCYSPRKSAQRGKSPMSRSAKCGRSAIRQTHSGEEKVPGTPTKVTLSTEDIENLLSPRKKLVVNLEPLPDEVKGCALLYSPPHKATHNKLMSPVRCPLSPTGTECALSPTRIASPVNSRRKLDLSTPQKSPLSPVTNIHQGLNDVDKGRFESPKSAVKRLNLCSPAKSPVRHLSISSPRRSPHKFNQENIPGFQNIPKKLPQSPPQFTSPSSLMSKVSLSSPEGRRKIAVSLFKPDVTAYRAVRQSLNTGTPTVLVCRERQVNEMREFLISHVGNGKPGSLYVSGAPGTGKTASLNSILDSLEVRGLKRVFLNCMALKTSAAIYKAILAELGHRVEGTEKENRIAIEKIVTSSKHTILLMLDEVDQLDSKNQEVLYTVFEWPALAKSKLVLVGIANSLDLTDRILPRLQARPNFRPRLLHYAPYTKAEIVSIINQRISEAGLGDTQVIRPAAIHLLAGKVASVSGDVRKALDVCRRAVELCEGQARKQAVLVQANGSPTEAVKMVDIPQVMSIFNEVYGSRVISAVTEAPDSFPLQQKVLICCYLLILKHARSKDITLGKFHEVYLRVCRKRQVPGMDQSEFLSVCTLLESRGMMQVKRSKEVRSSKVLLRLNAEEAERTLGDRSLLASILEDKESLAKLCKSK